MKRICLLILIAAAACTITQAQETKPTWSRYTAKGEEFSVLLPSLPAMDTSSEMVQRIWKIRQRRELGVYAGGLAFTVFCYENPSPRESLDDFIEQEIFTHSGWDRASEKELTLNGFTGRQYLSPNKIPGTMQIFATRKHIYRFHAYGATLEDARVKHFFSSIVLGSKKGAIEVTDGFYVPVTTTQGTENVLSTRDVDRKPLIVMKSGPDYTAKARANNLSGQVILKAIFSADGTIRNIRVAAGLPYGLDDSAIEAAKKIIFIPAMKDGKFVSMWMQLEYHFNIE